MAIVGSDYKLIQNQNTSKPIPHRVARVLNLQNDLDYYNLLQTHSLSRKNDVSLCTLNYPPARALHKFV